MSCPPQGVYPGGVGPRQFRGNSVVMQERCVKGCVVGYQNGTGGKVPKICQCILGVGGISHHLVGDAGDCGSNLGDGMGWPHEGGEGYRMLCPVGACAGGGEPDGADFGGGIVHRAEPCGFDVHHDVVGERGVARWFFHRCTVWQGSDNLKNIGGCGGKHQITRGLSHDSR